MKFSVALLLAHTIFINSDNFKKKFTMANFLFYFFLGGGKDFCPSDNKIIGMPIVLFPNFFPQQVIKFLKYYIKVNY